MSNLKQQTDAAEFLIAMKVLGLLLASFLQFTIQWSIFNSIITAVLLTVGLGVSLGLALLHNSNTKISSAIAAATFLGPVLGRALYEVDAAAYRSIGEFILSAMYLLVFFICLVGLLWYSLKNDSVIAKYAEVQPSSRQVSPVQAILVQSEPKRKRKRFGYSVRIKIWERAEKKCYMCGSVLKTWKHDEMHIDHIKPHSRGGKDDLANLQAACPSCNMQKGAKDHPELYRE